MRRPVQLALTDCFNVSPTEETTKILPKRNHQAIGAKANAVGSTFENWLLTAFNHVGIAAIKFPLGARRVGPQTLIQVKTPFDMILSQPHAPAGFIDAKHCADKNFTYSRIDENQADHLSMLHDHGHIAGYVVLFTATNDIVFFNGAQLRELRARESLSLEQGKSLGTYFEPRLRDLFDLTVKNQTATSIDTTGQDQE